jgi:hypothetical protein
MPDVQAAELVVLDGVQVIGGGATQDDVSQ